MRVQEASALEKIERLMIQVEMETRAEESIQAINQGDVVSVDEFQAANKSWAKKNYTK